MKKRTIILPNNAICLNCNANPRAGNDDLCLSCSERLLFSGIAGYRPPYDMRGIPIDRHHYVNSISPGNETSPGQQNAIRCMEDCYED